ncbi:hypothetical protein AVEN_70892-1 [Araneus ventricosus]|uniref:Uncharacterized protein n=1 Tax=Araneus ventricosus TaxID=182803 RepID=A0A4Y2X567_ARAVE|nr:hypothetical protein AVEN_70892-1 [Araneus ventricosus]
MANHFLDFQSGSLAGGNIVKPNWFQLRRLLGHVEGGSQNTFCCVVEWSSIEISAWEKCSWGKIKTAKIRGEKSMGCEEEVILSNPFRFFPTSFG